MLPRGFLAIQIPANLAQLAVPKMHCLYANAVVQPSVQHCPCYMAWKTKVHTWCRHCHLYINALMWREKRWLQGLFLTLPRISDYRYTNRFKNNTFNLALQQLCKMITFTNMKWQHVNQNYPYSFCPCPYLQNKSPSRGIHASRKSMPCAIDRLH